MSSRKHLHTALVILSSVLTASAQFSEVWTNGDYFATHVMASECYSGSVERCEAVGITPDSPSWWDYLVGKNRAKLVSVKNNIRASCTNYVNKSLAYYYAISNGTYLAWVTGLDPATIRFTNEVQFLSEIGLPTNALDETPYFKLQYPSTTGGWYNVYVMLTNLVWTWGDFYWSDIGELYEDSPAVPPLDLVQNRNYGAHTNYLSYLWPYTTWDYTLSSYQQLISACGYGRYSMGSWTTSEDDQTWSTNWTLAKAAVDASFYSVVTNDGVSWGYVMEPYQARTRPKQVVFGVCDQGNFEITYNLQYATNYTYYKITNMVEQFSYWDITTNQPLVETNYDTYGSNFVEVDYLAYDTNITTLLPTNILVSTPTSVVVVASTNFGQLVSEAFGTRYVGSHWEYYVTNLEWQSVATNIDMSVFTSMYFDVSTPVYTSNFEYVWETNNVYSNWLGSPVAISNVVYTNIQEVLDATNKTVYVAATNSATTNSYTLRYAAGKTSIKAWPSTGAWKEGRALSGLDREYWSEGTNALTTNYAHEVDFYCLISAPLVASNWHEWHSSSPRHFTNYIVSSTFDDFGADFKTIVPHYPGWIMLQSTNTTDPYVVAKTGLHGDSYGDDSESWPSAAYMTNIVQWGVISDPAFNQLKLGGWEVSNDFCVIRWDVTNGFRYK